MEMLGGALDYGAGADVFGPAAGALEHRGYDLDVRLHAAHLAESYQLVEGAFQLADIALDAGGQKLHDVLGQAYLLAAGFGLQNGAAGLKIRRLHVYGHAPGEPRAQALLKRRDILGWFVAAHDHLFVGLVKGVEGVEELLLDPFLAGQELDVVDDQHVGAAVKTGKIGGVLFKTQGIHEFLDELLG